VERFVDFHLHLPRRKKFKKSPSVDKVIVTFLGLLRCDSCRYNARKRESKLWHWHQDANKAQEGFHRNLASKWQYKATHKFENLVTNHKIWLDSVTPSPLWSWSLTLKISTCLEPWRMQSVAWILRVWFALWALCYRSRTRRGIDKAYIHWFLRARPWKWTETLWKKRVWT
jgi:hypothetical protein